MGLREQKKEQTRRLIADTAWQLFADRGFDQVSVAEIAFEARVAQATVFNYFPTKEDLFYSRLEAFGDRLVREVSARPPGEPALSAFGRALLREGGLLAQVEAGDTAALETLRGVNRVIAGSPALRMREQETIGRATASLAALLAAETGAADGDLTPQVAANALMGVHRALLDHVRERILSGEDATDLGSQVRKLAANAFLLIKTGLADYAIKSPSGLAGEAQVPEGRLN